MFQNFRGSKFSSMSYFYGSAGSSSAASCTTLTQSKGEGTQDKIDLNNEAGKQSKNSLCNDENDYIRTAIVTNANDKFMSAISLCLICGSVGKDIEGTMISCTSCAQSYHTYCVGMHEKVNEKILKFHFFRSIQQC